VNENMKDGTARATARRRLIRGAFAAPTALTLYSGNVFAASSSLRALNNQLADPQSPAPELPAQPAFPETWIRVQVYKDSAGVLYVKGSDVFNLPYGCGADRRFFNSLKYTKIADLNTQVDGTGLEPTTNYAALSFDNRGVIVGVSTGTAVVGQTALTQSAGTSLTGACLTRTRTLGADGFEKIN